MALKRLSMEEMIQISTPWVNAGDAAGEALGKIPLLTALLPTLQSVHGMLFGLRAQRLDPKTQRLAQEASALDAKHDELVRGIHGALTLLASLSEASDEILRLRDTLLPEGLSHTLKTYRGEAGHAAMVAAQLDTNAKASLKSLTLNDKSLMDLVQAWFDTAKQLGELEETRTRLNPPTGPSAADINTARLRWVRTVNAILANAELIGVDEATDHLLFAALRAAEKTADNRARGSEDSATPAATSPSPVQPVSTTAS